MTLAGVVVLDVMGILVVLWILNLTRLGRLYVGYAATFVVGILATLAVLSWPALRTLADGWARVLFPDAGLMVVLLLAIGLLLVYVFAQLTVIANRLATLIQELAIQQAADRARADRGASRAADREAPKVEPPAASPQG